jgi:elongation factor 1-gamma
MLLYTYPENFRAFKALIAAQFSGANLKIAPNFVFGETNKSQAFLKKFPLGKVSEFIKIGQFHQLKYIGIWNFVK